MHNTLYYKQNKLHITNNTRTINIAQKLTEQNTTEQKVWEQCATRKHSGSILPRSHKLEMIMADSIPLLSNSVAVAI